MSQTGEEIIIQPDLLREFACEVYQKSGISQEHAELMADLLVETDLRGVHSHRTCNIPEYIPSILKGDINPTPNNRSVREGSGFVVFDGRNGLGHPVSTYGDEDVGLPLVAAILQEHVGGVMVGAFIEQPSNIRRNAWPME